MESLQNGVVTHFQVTPLSSRRTELLASLQSYHSIDADAWSKWALMAFVQCRTRIRIPTRMRTPNPMATLYCTETVPFAWTQAQFLIQILIPDHYCTHFWDENLYPDWGPSWYIMEISYKVYHEGNYFNGYNLCTNLIPSGPLLRDCDALDNGFKFGR